MNWHDYSITIALPRVIGLHWISSLSVMKYFFYCALLSILVCGEKRGVSNELWATASCNQTHLDNLRDFAGSRQITVLNTFAST